MSARTLIADHLAAVLPAAYRIQPFPAEPDRVTDVTVMVWRENVTRGPVKGARANEVAIWVLTGHEDPRNAEDALDTALDTVLAALDELDTSSWESAERAVYAEKWHGYRVTIPIATT